MMGQCTFVVRELRVQRRGNEAGTQQVFYSFPLAEQCLALKRGAYDPETGTYANPDADQWEMVAQVDV